MSSNQNTQNSYSYLQFDEYAVRKLLCAVIEMAVEDYRLCVDKGIIQEQELNRRSSLNYDLPKTIENISEIKSILTFFFEGGLDRVIEAGFPVTIGGVPFPFVCLVVPLLRSLVHYSQA